MAEQYHAYTHHVPDHDRSAIVIPVTLGVLLSVAQQWQQTRIEVAALIDTGATCSCISREFAQKHGLQEFAKSTVRSAHGAQTVAEYYVDVFLPNGSVFYDIDASEFSGISDFDFIIGMNILNQADVAITNAHDHTVFSFRIPPDHVHIDYTSSRQ